MANDEGAPDHRGTRRAACQAIFGVSSARTGFGWGLKGSIAT